MAWPRKNVRDLLAGDKALSRTAIAGELGVTLKGCEQFKFSEKRDAGQTQQDCAILNSFGILPHAIV